MDTPQILKSIREWSELYAKMREDVFKREAPKLPTKDLACALVGVRRCGKTYMAVEMSLSIPIDQVFYYNFEDPLFYQFNNVKYLDLLLATVTEYSESHKTLLILDEIQNIDGWERWLRSLIDKKLYRIIVTGSSAKLLSSEIASSLTGRCLRYEVWPLSPQELVHRQPPKGALTDADYKNMFRKYLTWGGFPEITKISTNSDRSRVLRMYCDDILTKDILSRNDIRDVASLRQVLTFLLTNISSPHSRTSLKKAFSLGVDTAAHYIEVLNSCHLILDLARYATNLKTQWRYPKKIYAVDLGLRNANSLSTSDDEGKRLENAVFIELRRSGKEIFYFSEEYEVDFVVCENYKPLQLIQVCSDFTNEKTRTREIRALKEAMESLQLKQGLIITNNQRERITVGRGKSIDVIPGFQWCFKGL